MPGNLTISLRELRFYGPHGWHEEEALTGNEFLVDIQLSFVPNATLITNIDQTVNYAEVYETAKKVFGIREKLLETLAMKIAGALQVRFPDISWIRVDIRKLTAPLPGFEGSVGISYEQTFK